VTGVPGGSHLDSCGVRDLLGRVDRVGGELPSAGGRFASCRGGSWIDAVCLFSYAFFFLGYTALAVTVGAIVTLFLMMQWTGRVKWAERFNAS